MYFMEQQSVHHKFLMHSASIAGEGDLVAVPVALKSVTKGMSASEDAAEAGEPAGSQVQSGESGSLPQVRPGLPSGLQDHAEIGAGIASYGWRRLCDLPCTEAACPAT